MAALAALAETLVAPVLAQTEVVVALLGTPATEATGARITLRHLTHLPLPVLAGAGAVAALPRFSAVVVAFPVVLEVGV